MLKNTLAMSGELVLVTGASGFIATHVTKQLLEAGFKVRGTVRDLSIKKKVEPLRKLYPEAKFPLELIEADLLTPKSWHKAVEGCKYVIHIASPFPLGNPSNEEALIKPAVDGTLNVLRAVKDTKCVERVVFTSSAAAILDPTDDDISKTYTENHWIDVNRPKVLAYPKSKALAEKAAWDFMNENTDLHFNLAVMNPSFVIGPVLCGSYATSMEVIKRLMLREMPMVPKLNMRIVDVRDVAEAHVKALCVPEAAGHRHILFSSNLWFKEIADILHAEFSAQGYNIPRREAPTYMIKLLSLFSSRLKLLVPALDKAQKIDNSRMKDVLGVYPRHVNESVLDMAYSMVDNGFIEKTRQYQSRK